MCWTFCLFSISAAVFTTSAQSGRPIWRLWSHRHDNRLENENTSNVWSFSGHCSAKVKKQNLSYIKYLTVSTNNVQSEFLRFKLNENTGPSVHVFASHFKIFYICVTRSMQAGALVQRSRQSKAHDPGIEDVRGTISSERCPVTRDESEVFARQSTRGNVGWGIKLVGWLLLTHAKSSIIIWSVLIIFYTSIKTLVHVFQGDFLQEVHNYKCEQYKSKLLVSYQHTSNITSF